MDLKSLQGGHQRIGVAIGGGGARGAAAIGALKVLEAVGLRPQMVAGTSAGAIIGALYCSGHSPSDLQRLFCTQSRWRSLVSASAIEQLLRQLCPPTFSQLNIPLCCVATDIGTYTEQRLVSGDLARSVRASMAMPGWFGAVEIGGRRLVDGGLINNLPTDVVRQMGADVVVAIDLQQITFWHTRFSLKDSLGIGGLLHWAVSHPEVEHRRRNIALADIYVRPELSAIDGYLFSNSRNSRMIGLGERAALKALGMQ